MFKFHYHNGEKRKSGKTFSGLQNGAIRGLQIGAGFRDFKSGNEGLQIGEAFGISNRGKKFQIGAKRFQNGVQITNRGKKHFKLGQGLQVGEEQM